MMNTIATQAHEALAPPQAKSKALLGSLHAESKEEAAEGTDTVLPFPFSFSSGASSVPDVVCARDFMRVVITNQRKYRIENGLE